MWTAIKYIILAPLAIAAALFAWVSLFSPADPRVSEADARAAREVCAKAITSSLGHSTRGYADKLAYDQHVATNCKGFDLTR